MIRKSLIFAACAGALLGCSDDPSSRESVAANQSSVQTIPEIGIVPFPVQLDPTTLKPKLGPDGASLMSAWNGSVPDLLAADAYAECVTTGFDYQNYTDLGGATSRFGDHYLEWLRSNMAGATCPGASPVPTTPETIWLERRKRAACNVDTRSLTPRAVQFITSRDLTGYNTFTPAANTYWGLTASSTTVRDQVFRRASRHLGQADVNLCMALKLRSQLENPQSLFLTVQQQIELLEIIAQRSARSITDLTLIAKTHASADPQPSPVTSESQYLVALRKWLDAAPRSRIVQDLATGVKLHGAVMLDMIALLRRQASARVVPVAASTLALADFGSLSPRTKMLNVLNGNGWSWLDLYWYDDAQFQGVSIKDPLVNVLLGFARKQNISNPPEQLNWDPNSLYMATENDLRYNKCAAANNWPCSLFSAPPASQYREYKLYKDYRITPDHAKSLVAAMGYWTRHQYVLGNHVNGNLDQNFIVKDKPPKLFQPDLPWVPRTILFSATPEAQAIAVPTQIGSYGTVLSVAGVHALAYAREAFFDVAAKFPTTGADATTIKGALTEISRLIGDRSVIIRRQKLTAADDGLQVADVLTTTSDPFNRMIQFSALSANYVGFENALLDPASTGTSGFVNRATFDAMARITPTIVSASGTGPAAGLERRQFNYTAVSNGRLNLVLTQSAAGEQKYTHIADMLTLHFTPVPPRAAVLVSGGVIGAAVARTFARSAADRSRPAFDAFDFPNDWVPPADASLVGGFAGQESYAYYLDAAQNAADEASAAVKQSIESMLQQANDEISVYEAQQQAKQIALLETRNLCGPAASCDVAESMFSPIATAPNCTDACAAALNGTKRVLGDVKLAQLVIDEADDSSTSFAQFEGGEVQRVLLRQLTAKKMLNSAIKISVGLAVSYQSTMDAADAARAAAGADYTAAQADADAALAGIAQSDVEGQQMLQQLYVDVDTYRDQLAEVEREQQSQCSEQAFTDAFEAGYSASEHDDLTYDWNGSPSLKKKGDNYSFSPASIIQQHQACEKAWRERERVEGNVAELQQLIYDRYDALIHRSTVLSAAQRDAVATHRAAAEEKLKATTAAQSHSVQTAWSQLSVQVAQVQAALGEARGASAELAAVKWRTQNAVTRAGLEAELTSSTNASRWGLSNKYRSYDLWRARAMLENARRLSVAARKAIESRFVVDLSELDAPQTFVAAPSTWADSVYESDLSPSASIGLTAAPADMSGVYANKLSDYVNNLRLFVQGYTVTYPTSVAAPDTEVLTIPGPDLQVPLRDTAGAALDAESRAWTFYCPDTDSWIAHPAGAEFPIVSSLQTACGGKRPTRARYPFTVDPWGRLNGDAGQKPLSLRHNVRWRPLAVNIVGTGIRDCERSRDPVQCYSESFLRYDLSHAGPAWAANHNQSWRLIDMPTAFVEGGKALSLEEWLDPVNVSWSSSFVSNVSRSELLGRPVSGSYLLTLELPDDVVLSRIQRVQILSENDYWVAQH
jgi:hypothetical protein